MNRIEKTEGRVPRKDEIDQVFLLARVMYKAVLGLHFQSTSTATGHLVFHIFGARAECERNLMRERTLAGLEAARARRRVGGSPH